MSVLNMPFTSGKDYKLSRFSLNDIPHSVFIILLGSKNSENFILKKSQNTLFLLFESISTITDVLVGFAQKNKMSVSLAPK